MRTFLEILEGFSDSSFDLSGLEGAYALGVKLRYGLDKPEQTLRGFGIEWETKRDGVIFHLLDQ